MSEELSKPHSLSPNISTLLEKVCSLNMLQENFLSNSIKNLPSEELNDFERYIEYCLQAGTHLDYLAQSYDFIVKEMLSEQFYFRKNKKYRYSSYNEVASSVYMSRDYMSQYMYGLALTSFLWPNHAKMKRYFLQTIPKTAAGKYLEIGPGHGFYFMSAMKNTRYDFFEGVDISPTSVEMTNQIVGSRHFGTFSRYRIYECDFLKSNFSEPFDAVVMGEVLEHVESPRTFLDRIGSLTKPGGYIFITTCINSPALDHIFHFKSVDHLEVVIDQSNLAIHDKLVLPYNNTTLEMSVRKELPINVAYVLGKT
jgi:2-polyprenyl-3-methyl-5-hydroxy-6-metoxy-1,4-benzoquinol methylase